MNNTDHCLPGYHSRRAAAASVFRVIVFCAGRKEPASDDQRLAESGNQMKMIR